MTLKKTRQTMTKHDFAEVLLDMRVGGFDYRDLARVQRYFRGGQTCAEYDRLSAWHQHLINKISKVVKDDA